MYISWPYYFCCGLLLALSYGRGGQAPGSHSCSAAPTFKQTNDLLTNKRYEEAASLLDHLRQCPDLTPLESFEMGWLYGRARQFHTALLVFDRVAPAIPDRSTHAYAVALSKFELSDYRGAVSGLESLRSTGPLDTKSVNLLAVSYSKLGLYKQAYSVLNQQLGNEPDENTFLNIVTVCAEGGDYASAAQFASQAVEKFPNSVDAILVRGAASSLLGRSEQAPQDFANGVRMAPQRADARFFLALTDYDQARYSDALSALRQANQDGMLDSDLHYLTAETLLKIDAADTDPILAELNQALQLNTDSVAARTLRGRLLLDKNELKQALADLEVANRNDPGSRSTIYNLARVYRALGKTQQAADLSRQLRAGDQDILKEMGTRRLSETLADKGAAR